MTYGYTCGFGEDEHAATYILTNVTNGQTTAFCDEDAPVALIGALGVELGVDPGGLYEVIKAHVDKLAAEEAAASVREINKHRQHVPRAGTRKRKPRETVTGGAALSPELRGEDGTKPSGQADAQPAEAGASDG